MLQGFRLKLLKTFSEAVPVRMAQICLWTAKRECNVCSIKVFFNIDLSFNEIRRFYSKVFKKAYTHQSFPNNIKGWGWGDSLPQWREAKILLGRIFCEYLAWPVCTKSMKLKQKWCKSNDYS